MNFITFCDITALIEIHCTHFDFFLGRNKMGNLGVRKKGTHPYYGLATFFALVFFISNYMFEGLESKIRIKVKSLDEFLDNDFASDQMVQVTTD